MSFSSDLKAYREKHSYTQAAAGGNGVKAITIKHNILKINALH